MGTNFWPKFRVLCWSHFFLYFHCPYKQRLPSLRCLNWRPFHTEACWALHWPTNIDRFLSTDQGWTTIPTITSCFPALASWRNKTWCVNRPHNFETNWNSKTSCLSFTAHALYPTGFLFPLLYLCITWQNSRSMDWGSDWVIFVWESGQLIGVQTLHKALFTHRASFLSRFAKLLICVVGTQIYISIAMAKVKFVCLGWRGCKLTRATQMKNVLDLPQNHNTSLVLTSLFSVASFTGHNLVNNTKFCVKIYPCVVDSNWAVAKKISFYELSLFKTRRIGFLATRTYQVITG